ncbi:SH3 domain-containing protein [Candidatus Uhrbacteria bacterium]|nr:SH3 domain-containing protein [Candidatus Uhrbacteria bacterium]MBD3284644.1 SH3 domain-containing protein [Candidatus Uhrbacteria bacterium]
MRSFISILTTLSLLLVLVPSVQAGGCYVDPVIAYSGSGTISSAVFLRDHACMDGSKILSTLSGGSTVNVIGYTDGWYRVEVDGARGWIGQQFLNNDASKTGKQWDRGQYHTYMSEYPSKGPTAAEQTQKQSHYRNRAGILNNVRGYILLQVENHGEAWYVDPITDKRFYMKDGPTAYQMMRSFGLGVTEVDYNAMAAGDWSMKDRLRGRIILRVQEHGEAYYIHPKDLTMHYLQNGEEAYRIMRLHSLGITNTDLDAVETDEIPIK